MNETMLDGESYRALGRFLRLRTVSVDLVVDAAFRLMLEGGDPAFAAAVARSIVSISEKIERLTLVELDRSSLRAALLRVVSGGDGELAALALDALEKSDKLEGSLGGVVNAGVQT